MGSPSDSVDRRTIAIGDIHGCGHALDAVLSAIAPTPNDRIIVLGDMIDNGRETQSVIETLINLRDRTEVICLKGNHEEMLLEGFTSLPAQRYWEDCGGVSTLNSYRFGGTLTDIPESHIDFIRKTRDWFETDTHIFVHANPDPDLPMSEQPDYMLRWATLDAETFACHKSRKTAIMGHTEQKSGEVLDLGCIKCIDTACWRYGWLTAVDVETGTLWQADRFGMLREQDEQPVGPLGPPRPW